MYTYNAIYDTEAEIKTDSTGNKSVWITKLAGLPVVSKGVVMSLKNGYTELEVSMTATKDYTWLNFDPAFTYWADVVLVFENLDGLEFTITNDNKDVFSLTDEQLEFMCLNRLEHIALINKVDGKIERYHFHDKYTTYYDGATEGGELLRIIANRISAAREVLKIRSSDIEDVVQFSPVR